jgi:hypothetical protein
VKLFCAIFRISELRVVDLLDGLCDKMLDYTLRVRLLNYFALVPYLIILLNRCLGVFVWKFSSSFMLQETYTRLYLLRLLYLFDSVTYLDLDILEWALLASCFHLFLQIFPDSHEWYKVGNWDNLITSMHSISSTFDLACLTSWNVSFCLPTSPYISRTVTWWVL